MEDVLAIYEKPLSEREPVVCVDEKPVVLQRRCPPAAAHGGRDGLPGAIRVSAARHGQRFCGVQPKADGTLPNDCEPLLAASSPIIWWRSWPASPEADTIHLVLDNLSSHKPQGAGGPVRRKDRRPVVGAFHGALHPQTRQLAETGGIEISLFSRQCLGGGKESHRSEQLANASTGITK